MAIEGVEYDRFEGEPDDPLIHIGRLDIKVGRIIGAHRYPPGHKSYTEQIDLGEGNDPGLASSELVKYYKKEDLKGRLVVALINVIPLDHRNIACRTQILTASDLKWNQLWADNVQLLVPPPGSVPGDQVTVAGYPYKPDKPYVNPNTSVFERIAAKLKVNEDGLAVYKDVPLEVVGKGFVTGGTLKNCSIVFD